MQNIAAQPDRLGLSYQRRTGLVPAGPETLAVELERLHDHANSVLEHWYSRQLPSHFVRGRELFGRSQLQIGYSDPNGLDLMIGDAPVLLMKENHEGLGPHQGVAIGDANQIVMPISPTVMLALGPQQAAVDLSDIQVAQYNLYQAKAAIRWFGARPHGPSDELLRAHAPAWMRCLRRVDGRSSEPN